MHQVQKEHHQHTMVVFSSLSLAPVPLPQRRRLQVRQQPPPEKGQQKALPPQGRAEIALQGQEAWGIGGEQAQHETGQSHSPYARQQGSSFDNSTSSPDNFKQKKIKKGGSRNAPIQRRNTGRAVGTGKNISS